MVQITVPDVGEAQDVEVIELLVAVGDAIDLDQSILVLESDKASMEVPSPVAGVITSINVALGDTVEEGDLLVELEAGAPAAEPPQADPPEAGADTEMREPEPRGIPATRPATTDSATPGPAQTTPAASTPAAGPTAELQVAVPDVGEATDIEVIEILVAVGDEVDVDASLLVLESDKASMEVPSPAAGTVATIHVEIGQQVEEGNLLITLAGTAGGEAAVEAASAPAPEQAPASATPAAGEAAPRSAHTSSDLAPPPQPVAQAPAKTPGVHAGPAVRKLGRELGVDLAAVKGTGKRKRILKQDVQAYVKTRLSAPAAGNGAGGAGIPPVPEVDFSKFGETTSSPMSRIRRASARNLHRSWLNVPHVTQFDEADVTELEAFRRQRNAQGGVKLTPLAFLVRACVAALQAFPRFNASLDAGAENLIVKHYYHIGIAVETDDGLVVPVLKDADRMGIAQIAEESAGLAAKARDGKLGMGDLTGACFTISSLGGIGGTAFTPIVNAPEVAILGVSRTKVAPVWNGDAFEPRTMLPLSLSYDHRAIDGAEAARFAAYLADVLGDIRTMLL